MKKLSKKEQKAKEDAEFEALMNEVGVKEAKNEEAKKPEEAATAQPGEASSKNKKKKEKRKAKQTADAKEETKAPEEGNDLSPEDKAAAVKAALAKRGNI